MNRLPRTLPEEQDATAIPLEPAVDEACSLVPPLWPLRHFVAVNPFLGFVGGSVVDGLEQVERLFHGRTLMPQDFYRREQARGRIADGALEQARDELAGTDPQGEEAGSAPAPPVLTLADCIDRAEGSDWARRISDEVAKWCAVRFDDGQAAWAQPWSELGVFAAWRAWASVDRGPEIQGLAGFRDYVKGLPERPMEVVERVLGELGVAGPRRAEFLARQLASVSGWAGHLQYRARQARMEGRSEDALRDLLAIRLAFDGALAAARGDGAELLRRLSDSAVAATGAQGSAGSDFRARYQWQLAYEADHRRRLLTRLQEGAGRAPAPAASRPELQAVFCIDVRSEVLRRHLEAQDPGVQTLGFAGFFGFALELAPPGEGGGAPRCPVLIPPALKAHEEAADGEAAWSRVRRARERHGLFGALRKHALGAFPMVETLGWGFAFRLVSDSLGWTRPRPDEALWPLDGGQALRPALVEAGGGPASSGPDKQLVDLAEGALRNMGLVRDFAPVVLLCGHGSQSANNPYASSLDCGACGGHAGDTNARVACAVLNDPAVREELAGRGIRIPEDTRFVPGLHDTTTDRVALFDADSLPAEQRVRIEGWLARAGVRTGQERAPALAESPDPGLAGRLLGRSRDWSQVRPEWGLANNAAFVAAPRQRTRGLDLEGRCFLHDYDPEQDRDGAVLELILTAPLVVASWINLQYYASTVDNEVFGSGNKTLHNVVGRHGVMLGNRSDLRCGLPWQSVHDGDELRHEPMRLQAIVEAPRDRIDAILEAHDHLRDLVENGWLHLLAWEPEAGRFHRRLGAGRGWETVAPA